MNIEIEGQQAYFSTGGEAHRSGAPAIIFVHGAAMDHSIWTLYARFYAKAGYNVVALDLPGHGKSAGTLCPTIEASAEWLCMLADRLQLASPALVGHSMGSLVALEAATCLPNCSALVMMGSSFPMAVSEPLLTAARNNDHAAVDMISLFGHSFAAQLGCNPVAGISIQNLAERLMEQAGKDVMYTDLNACNEYANGLSQASQVKCPVTLILGSKDMMTPVKSVQGLMDNFPDARQIRLANCGHMMFSEQPEATHQALASALGYRG